MMGCQTAPVLLFYDLCIDDHVPLDHMLRGIDHHLETAHLPVYGGSPAAWAWAFHRLQRDPSSGRKPDQLRSRN